VDFRVNEFSEDICRDSAAETTPPIPHPFAAKPPDHGPIRLGPLALFDRADSELEMLSGEDSEPLHREVVELAALLLG
jgi:hypothetical protein